MKIIKFGHCCMLIEEGGLRALTDPSIFSPGQDDLKNLDIILFTHDHFDHIHIDSLKAILVNNPNVEIITNKQVGKLLEQEKIKFTVLNDGEKINRKEILIEAFGKLHAIIHSSIPQIENTGYFIANRFFYPGDNFTNPNKPIEILALPVVAPWLKLGESIDYAIEVNPKACFPVHDGIISSPGAAHKIPKMVLEPKGIKFDILEIGKEYEF